MSQLQITDWFQWVPAPPVHKKVGVLTVDAFEVDSVVWKDASEIYQQINYAADSSFYLTLVPSAPTGSNVGICIRYRVGENVTRYKLNNPAGFVLNDEAAPLYNGEVIKANFVLEFYNLEDETDMILADDIVLETSLRTIPDNLRELDNSEIATGTVVTYAELLSTASSWESAPPTVTRHWLKADEDVTVVAGEVTEWISQSASASVFTPSGTGPTFIASDSEIYNLPCVHLDAVAKNIRNVAGGAYAVEHMFLLVKQVSWTAANNIITHTSLIVQQNNVTPELRLVRGAGTVDNNAAALDTWYIVEVFWRDNLAWIVVYDFLGNVTTQTVAQLTMSTSTTFTIGSITGISADAKLAELLSYQFALTDAERALAVSYLKGRVGVALAPLTFNAASAWEDNA